MKPVLTQRLLAGALGLAAALAAPLACAEDIDIFTGASAGAGINPRVLIILDNTSNWSRQNQHWPGGVTQGESEVRAIKSVIQRLPASVNVGLMELITDSTDPGGFVRFDIQPMTDTAKVSLSSKLDTIYTDVNSSKEKRSSNAAYGDLMNDVYNYLSGLAPVVRYPKSSNELSYWDPYAYTYKWYRFASPLSADSTCSKTFVIFIGNPNSSGPSADSDDNDGRLAYLVNLLGGTSGQLHLPNFTTTETLVPAPVTVTNQCYASQSAAATELSSFATQCLPYSEGCTIGAAVTDTALNQSCADNTTKWHVIGTNKEITNEPTGGSTLDTKTMNADEWARLLHDKGVNPPSGSSIRPSVTTYTIDVYNAQPNATHTSLMLSMARAGGGKYFAAQSEQSIINALETIIGEIMAVNSSFASTSLPVNATNRSQNENQVFIGMFRPDPNAHPRWFGNLKRYQLVAQGDGIELGDANGDLAINTLTGFLTPCATSYWTTDSGDYWSGMGISPDPAGSCDKTRAYSDAPDGPLVEKGAVGQVIRNGNNPPLTTSAPTYAINRTIYTRVGSELATFNTANTGLSESVVNFIRGEDVNNEKGDFELTKARPSLHGDVIHSRPLPINYGGTTGVVVFYGANDGTFRAVSANSGKELWAFVAPEFNSRLERLKTGYPTVNYPTSSGPSTSPTAMPKDYYFDGSTGVLQKGDGSQVWVFPTMRRGGRMLYGFDVTTPFPSTSSTAPASPRLMWYAGCPNLHDDVGCTTNMAEIGQTWSMPSVAYIKGYSETEALLLVGGGYDKCEDVNNLFPTCSSAKGRNVYILKASTGEVVAKFPTARGVAADIVFADIDNDSFPDYAYATDIGGSIYRIDFIDSPSTKVALAPTAWRMNKVAYTTGAGRKFLFAPAVLPVRNKVYLAIGSGDREHPLAWQYPYNGVRNRFYVRLDDLTIADSTRAQNLDTMLNYTLPSSCTTAGVMPASSQPGWFMELARGEQTVTSALIASGMVTFSTNMPLEGSAASCQNSLGVARGYWVNLFNASGAVGVAGMCGGDRSSTFIGGGLPPSPVLATGVPVAGRAVSVVIGAAQRHAGGGGGASVSIAPQRVRPVINSKRKRVYQYTKGQ